MPACAQNIVEFRWHECSVRHGDVGKLRRQRSRNPDLVTPHLAGVPLLPGDLAQAVETPAVAYADLRGSEHQEGLGKARRRGSVDFEVTDGELARAQLDRTQVVHIDGAVAGEPRPHEERNVVAPRDERLLEKSKLLASL